MLKLHIMYERTLYQRVKGQLAHYPAVALLGPRQVGKTTLARKISSEQSNAIYLDLENPEDLQRISDPVHYFDIHADKLIILDEVQHYPNLFMPLRGVIDARREEGRGNGNFLILGSATGELLKQSSESLAGRISYLELSGLNLLEVEKTDQSHLQKLWVRGGFPNSYAATSDIVSYEWRNNFIKTYLERDIRQIGTRFSASELMRFWICLANGQGTRVNASALSSLLGVSSATVGRYLNIMEDLLLIRRLKPWYSNAKKRQVKSSKTYIRDSGLLHLFLQITNYESLLGNHMLGQSWEGFVIENIASVLPSYIEPFFYQNASSKAEIDLLLQMDSKELWAIEIKHNRTPTLRKGFYSSCEDLERVTKKFVIYPGEETFYLRDKVEAISLNSFLEKLRNHTASK